MQDTALPATLTAVHVALAILRRHRAGRRGALSPFVLPSFAFAATPWIWPAPVALAIAAAVHVAWMMIAEILAPAPPARPVPARPVPARPVPPGPARATRPAVGATAEATVLAVFEETPEIKTFRLARPEGFEFEPGQFVAVRVQIDGRPHVRCYSLVSPPAVRGYLEIAVRRQGTVSNVLHALLRPGSRLTILRPAGTFVYPASDDRPLALIAGGVGITPLLCMLRHAVSSDPTRPVTLLYSARREQDVAFADELRLLAARHPQVRIAPTLTKPDHPSRWRQGRIDAEMLRQHVPEAAHTIFCLCGPGDMIRDVSAILKASGVPAGQIRSEQFETAAAAATLNPAAEPDVARGQATAGGFRVRFAASGRETTSSGRETLLEAAESAGITIPSSCRSGVCQSCRTRLDEGDADCRSDMLDPDDRSAGYILPCVSWATADCVLDA